jgi:hypothetical protein
MWPLILHSSDVLEVLVQSPRPNSTDEMATSSTSSVLNAINAEASEVSPSAPSSSNQTVPLQTLQWEMFWKQHIAPWEMQFPALLQIQSSPNFPLESNPRE